ncbi:SLAC1 anion channel family protein [Mucilaginibacter celer]|uniref:C4-dicarboxylate ABC transporter n=1 Tax=Mucilaginibacter celer TaxID=2305508 RepID=A0A494VVQ9_9SPHI|nr:SLAC1 anion channel family protein [Mucilaginibacter celer]AYL95388.1 C4-dicarboxylate ABC transporter [Mucilaginibacter celer]
MMNSTASPRIRFLEFLPVSLFGGVMGLTGLCFAWRMAADHWALNHWLPEAIGLIAVLAFIALTITYTVKIIRFPSLIYQEMQDPVAVCFFATFIVCLLLLPGVILPYFPAFATALWCIGALMMFCFAWYVLRKWFDHQQQPQTANPSWVLPVVGTLDIPIVGYKLAVPSAHEISLIAFSIGIFFSIILLTIIFSRLLFQVPLPEAVQPTLMILTGPLALAFSVYHGLTGNLDLFSGVLFYFNLFLLVLFGSKIMLIPKVCPFKVSWWSVSFPLTAVTVTSLIYAGAHTGLVHQLLAGILLAVTTLVIIYIFIITVYQIITGTFSPPVNLIK